MRITNLVAEAMTAPAMAIVARVAIHGRVEAPTIASIASIAIATPETEEADEKRHRALAALIRSVIKARGYRCKIDAVVNEILTWPIEDHTDMLSNRPLLECAVMCVAERHRIWYYGEAARQLERSTR